MLKGIIECESDGYVQATIAGMTNTLRFKHAKPLVNLPSVEKPYGKEIRGLLTAPEGYVAVSKAGGAVKLVDRLEFSRANFSGGQTSTRK